MKTPKHISKSEPVIWPERSWMTWTTRLLVPHALTKPADAMPVFVAVSASGNRVWPVTFSLS